MKFLFVYCLLLPILAFAIGQETSSEWKETDKDLADEIIKPKMEQALKNLEDEKSKKVKRRLEYSKKKAEEKEKAPTFKSCMYNASSCFSRTNEKALKQILLKGGVSEYEAELRRRCSKTTFYGINCLKDYQKNKLKESKRRYAP